MPNMARHVGVLCSGKRMGKPGKKRTNQVYSLMDMHAQTTQELHWQRNLSRGCPTLYLKVANPARRM